MRPVLPSATIDALARALASTEASPSTLAQRHAARARARAAREADAKDVGARDSKTPPA
jgi:hypothetical protein